MESTKVFSSRLESDEEAKSLCEEVRVILSEKYKTTLVMPDLIATPDRAESFMCSFPPHSSVAFCYLDDLMMRLMNPRVFGKTGDNSLILYNHPNHTSGTRDTVLYARGFAHELGHAALNTHPDLIASTHPLFDSPDNITYLHEGIATIFEHDLSQHLLEGDNGKRFDMGTIRRLMLRVLEYVEEKCPVRLTCSARISKIGYDSVSQIMQTLELSMSEVLENPQLVLNAMNGN